MKSANDNFDFTAIIREFQRDFPDIAARVYFIDSFTKEYVSSHPDIDARFVQLTKANTVLRETLDEHLKIYGAEKNSAALWGPEKSLFIMLYTGPDAVSLLDNTASHEQAVTFIFDHELGHIVTDYGAPGKMSRTLHECSADTYAALRHMQRFENGRQAVESLCLRRAQRLVSLHGTRHADHFTSFTLDKLLEAAHDLPLHRITPQQTAALASRIALVHTPNDQIVQNIRQAFKPFQDALAQQPGDDTPYRILAQTVLETNDWEIFKWGAPVLRGYMEGTLRDMRNGETLVQVNKRPLEGVGWQHVSHRLAQREFAFNREQILFGLDLPAAPAAKASVSPIRKKL